MLISRLVIVALLITACLSRSYNSRIRGSQQREREQLPEGYGINSKTPFYNNAPDTNFEEGFPEVIEDSYYEWNLRNKVVELEQDIVSIQNIPVWLICQIMERIAEIFRNRLPPSSGTQFAVLAIVPQSVQQPDQIDSFLAPEYENINYRFTRPTRFPNQNCRTHAEMVAMEGGPNEQFSLQAFYQGFVNANPDNAPRFAVLYTWIYPCRDCTNGIVSNFGRAEGDNPAFPVPTYVGRTTQGNLLHPPLTDDDRTEIANLLLLHLIRLFYIRVFRSSTLVLEMENPAGNMTMIAESIDNDLCDSCYLSNKNVDNIFNCEDTGSSSPDECPANVGVEMTELNQNNKAVKITTDEPCCQPGPVNLFTAAKGQQCQSDSPCGYHGYSYVWCNLQGGGWEYCCTGACGNHGDKGYDWCQSGDKWQYCHRNPAQSGLTATGAACKSDHQCGFHGNDYSWCYKAEGGWDYCCTSNCEQYGKDYDWCTAGNEWQYCKRELPGDKISAKQETCKQDSPCGYHGNDYAWCYLDEGSWDYCCTGDCGPHGNKYDWCTSGKEWSKCKMSTLPSSMHTYDLKDCISNCDYYGYDYAWCYTPGDSWDYCCTQECGLNGEKYDWCTTGISGNWQYCKRESLPEIGITAKGTKCRSDHSCGYHGYDYSWCYTSSSWDYCCSSTCGKYNTDNNFCAAGKQSSSCCCSEY